MLPAEWYTALFYAGRHKMTRFAALVGSRWTSDTQDKILPTLDEIYPQLMLTAYGNRHVN